MGGEPDEDNADTRNKSNSFTNESTTVGVSSYKAPILLPHPTEADDEHEMDISPPPVVEQHEQHGIQQKTSEIGNQMMTLKVPAIHGMIYYYKLTFIWYY